MNAHEIEQLRRSGYRLAAAHDGHDWQDSPSREEIAKAERLAFVGRSGTVVVDLDEEGEVESWQASSVNAEEDADTAFWRSSQAMG